MRLPAVEILHRGRWLPYTADEVTRIVRDHPPSSGPIETHVAAWVAFLDGHVVERVRRPGGAMPRPEGGR